VTDFVYERKLSYDVTENESDTKGMNTDTHMDTLAHKRDDSVVNSDIGHKQKHFQKYDKSYTF